MGRGARTPLLVAALIAAALLCASSASAATPGVQHLSFKAGPFKVRPGQNRIEFSPTRQKPAIDGYILGIKPNMERLDGSVPRSDLIMLHHAVWLNLARHDVTRPRMPERFFATGEEKTHLRLPAGYGYPYKASDPWLLNYMIHNLRPGADQVYVTYDIDFLPATAPAARTIRSARPAWMDVENGKVYPVFDSIRGSGHHGRFTYPTDDPTAYAGRRPANTWTVDRDSVLIGTAGHVHAGGLWNDLYLRRKGARYRGPRCAKRRTATARARCRAHAPSVRGNRVHLFRSRAKYFEPLGPVSWDMANTVTPSDYRVQLKKGDKLITTATYESKRASWYESMGIMVSWLADRGKRVDPFRHKVDVAGKVTHGHLRENRVHGGKADGARNPARVPSGAFSPNFTIDNFSYTPSAFVPNRIPVVRQGQSITFTSTDAAENIYHSVTSCRQPCNRSTGIGYPIANGKPVFDSGQLGYGGPPTVNTDTWKTKRNLKPGTYTFYCRIHPVMRGSFRVTKR